MNYNNINISSLFKEEFSWWLLEGFDNIEIVKKIIRKEKPTEIFIQTRKNLFGKCCMATAKEEKIKISFFGSDLIESLRAIEKIIKRYSLYARFHKIPQVKTRDFVATKYKDEKKQKPRILFLGFDDAHFNRLKDIVEEIKERGKQEPIVLCNDITTQKRLEDKKTRFVSYGNFLNEKSKRDAQKINKEIVKMWESLKNNKKFQNIFSYKKINLWEALKDKFSDLFLIEFPRSIYIIKAVEKLYDKLGIDCVVSMSDDISPSRPPALVAKNKKITSLIVKQYASGNINNRYMLHPIAKNIIVWGKGDKDFLRKFIKNKKIYIAGTSRLDHLRQKVNSEQVYSKFNLRKDKGIIVLTTQYPDDAYVFLEKETEVLVKSVISAMKEFPDKQLIIKLHPLESGELPNVIVKEMNAKNIQIIKDIVLGDLLRISEILIMINSTSAIEAMMLNKPVINFNPFKRPCATRYVKSGATIGVSKEKEVVKAIKSIYKNKRVRKRLEKKGKKFIKHYCYKNDGKATQRMVNIIEKIIKENKNNLLL
jgi:hypothetical protein